MPGSGQFGRDYEREIAHNNELTVLIRRHADARIPHAFL